MNGYEKTKNLKMNKIKGNNIADIRAVSENFDTIDDYMSKLQLKDDKVEIDLSDYAQKGKIIPPDLKNCTKLVMEISVDSQGEMTVKWLNESGEFKTSTIDSIKELLAALKSGISNNHDAINSIENELNGKTDRIKAYNDTMYRLFR